jgi:hypothetical protein
VTAAQNAPPATKAVKPVQFNRLYKYKSGAPTTSIPAKQKSEQTSMNANPSMSGEASVLSSATNATQIGAVGGTTMYANISRDTSDSFSQREGRLCMFEFYIECSPVNNWPISRFDKKGGFY